MKILKEVTDTRTGKRKITVELDADDELIAVNPNLHYRLGHPLEEDVIIGHIISDIAQVSWCSVEQKWV